MQIRMKLSLVLFIIGLLKSSQSVKINKLEVPEVIHYGKPVVLDCDFTLEDKDDELVVKWFFNGKWVYQWIPGAKKRPQGLGILKDRLNLEYAASVDANSIHRALHILKADPDLSGNYTCSVSTVQSEDIETKSMLVLVSEKNLLLRVLNAKDGFINVECIAEGIFPMPDMVLRSQQRNITEPDVTFRRRGKLFEVSATTTLPALNDPEEFSCKLHIPEANYTTRRETVFYPGSSGNLNSNLLWLTAVIYIVNTSLGYGITHIGRC
ncbi:selection and upkeep of intraepithelial T-cells protein 1 [Leptinotarsa decemlineata]|uniref:selection and upkeep of intraepithelial T-cells protein 1 n=1 Tax=Leptinotarsa decemlineata TaxID=7539 RepID=UPI003D3084EC